VSKPLSVKDINRTEPGPKLKKLSDEGGLQLWIAPSGSRTWRLMYRFDGKQRSLTIGPYPEIPITAARAARDDARSLLRSGIDPQAQRAASIKAKEVAEESTFGYVAEEFLQKKIAENRSAQTIKKMRSQLAHALPELAPLAIDSITAPQILPLLRRLEARKQHDTAISLRALIGAIFRYGIALGKATNDPTYVLRGALATPKPQHRAAIIEPKPFGALLRAIDGYRGMPETQYALQLLALTAVRPGELRNATWDEFDLSNALWKIPAGRMKMRREHRVPLSQQALAVLEKARQIHRGGPYVFPGGASIKKPLSENALNVALQTMGYKDQHTAHGFRSTFASITNESALWHSDAIERQLAHEENNKVRRAYHRAEYWDERVALMDWWGWAVDAMRADHPLPRERDGELRGSYVV
jgi:integrase